MSSSLFSCRLQPDYYFDRCAITSCKNHSPVLDSHCLLLERKECLNNDKGMTDYEIKYFKGYSEIRQITKLKREASHAVYAILILDRYLDYCLTLPAHPIDLTAPQFRRLRRRLTRYPLNVPLFTVNPDWLYYVFSPKHYRQFAVATACSMCKEYPLHTLLGLEQIRLRRITKSFAENLDGSTQSS